MPLIAHSRLPSFARLKREGELILSESRAYKQNIRELHVGLLNMMPDAALEVTERQFFRLVGQSNQIAQFFIHPFSLTSIKRSTSTKAYIKNYYQSVEEIYMQGLDALIITGAEPALAMQQTFLLELEEVIKWAYENVTSTLCSCFATHMVLQFHYQKKRQPLKEKCWGVFPHQVMFRAHPLVSEINTRFDVPHSRFNEISKAQFLQAGLTVLVESQIGVHLAVSEDLLRLVFLQGHPEYDSISLLKEYKREVNLFLQNKRDYPCFPKNYLSEQAKAILSEFKQKLLDKKMFISDFPEQILLASLDNTWRDSAIQVMNNWLGCVYQVTHKKLNKPFMSGVDKNNPLNLKSKLK